MSRIGKLPVNIPDGVTIEISKGNFVVVKGKFGEMKRQLSPELKIEQQEDKLIVSTHTDSKRQRSMHGLTRSLLNNMVIGVSERFSKKLEVIGVGYRASVQGQQLELNVGYSHPIILVLPPEIEVIVEQEKRKNAFITLKGVDKQLVGQIAAKIRSYRKPEPYKGKGIRYVDEYVRKKVGKAAAE